MKTIQYLFLDDVNGLEDFSDIENLVFYFSEGKIIGWLDMRVTEFEDSYGGFPIEHFFPTEEDVEKIKQYLVQLGVEQGKDMVNEGYHSGSKDSCCQT